MLLYYSYIIIFKKEADYFFFGQYSLTLLDESNAHKRADIVNFYLILMDSDLVCKTIVKTLTRLDARNGCRSEYLLPGCRRNLIRQPHIYPAGMWRKQTRGLP